MLYFISAVLIIYCFIEKKSKIGMVVMFALLWVLLGWSRDLADTIVYINRYEYTSYFSEFTEPIFTFIFSIGHKLGLSYFQYLIALSFFCLAVRFFVVNRLAENKNFIFALYLWFPLCLDACWLRLTLAVTFVYIGVYFLLKKTIKGVILFVALTLVATGIHSGSILFMALLIPMFINARKTIIWTTIFTIGSLFAIKTQLVNLVIIKLLGQNKYEIMKGAYKLTGEINNDVIYRCLSIVAFAMANLVLLYMVKKRLLKYKEVDMPMNIRYGNTRLTRGWYVDYLTRVNILYISLIPLTVYISDIYRIQLDLALLNYIAFSFYFLKSHKKSSGYRSNFLFIVFCLLAINALMYLYIYNLDIINTVLIPFFSKNSLL